MRRSFLLGLLILISVSFISAQNKAYYTVQVGTFLDAKPQDFNLIRPMGFLHVGQLNGNLNQVFIGGYNDKAAAESMAAKLRKKGYSNAFVQERFLNEGQTVTVIQMATRTLKKPIEWEKFQQAGTVYGIVNGDKAKIVTGIYQNVDAAKKQLPAIRKLGFKDAFIKKVNSVFLHEVTEFTTGFKKDLIPLAFDNQPTTRRSPNRTTKRGSVPSDIPADYDVVTARSPNANPAPPGATSTTARAKKATYSPKIRSKVKRRSVLELQKILKAERTYTSSLDGYYGPGTKKGYDTFISNNREVQKYLVLAEYGVGTTGSGVNDRLQRAINNLLNDPSAPLVIEGSNTPVAKAYQAYLLFTSLGPGNEVNSLMNAAIKQAYASKRLNNQPPFDYRATYAYQDLDQLILHLHYVHAAPGNQYAVPCWLFENHQKETSRAYESFASFANGNFQVQGCDQFLTWNEVKTMQVIAQDLNTDKQLDAGRLAVGASQRARLFLAPQALSKGQTRELEIWNQNLMNGLNAWGARDPFNQRLVTAFKASYFQSQIRFEDYFMDQGFKKEQAQGLAWATLQSIVGYHLERFI